MARSDHQVNVRITVEMKARLDEAASTSGRSFTAEVVHRLEQSFAHDAIRSDLDIALMERLRGLNSAIRVFREEAERLAESTKRPNAAMAQRIAQYKSQANAFENDRQRLLDYLRAVNPSMGRSYETEVDPEQIARLLQHVLSYMNK